MTFFLTSEERQLGKYLSKYFIAITDLYLIEGLAIMEILLYSEVALSNSTFCSD